MKIELHPYDREWPRLYQQLLGELVSALHLPGLRLEHIGSTAVAGMPAKPVIDILAGIPELYDLDELPGRLLQLQDWFYVPYWEEALPGRRFFIRHDAAVLKPDPEVRIINDASVLELPYFGRSAHLHVVRLLDPFFEKHIRFRDILRSNHAVRKKYIELKSGLAKQEWSSGASYAEAKSAFIRSVLSGGGI